MGEVALVACVGATALLGWLVSDWLLVVLGEA